VIDPGTEGPPQLQIDGGEVSTEKARSTSHGGRGGGGLSFAQRAILRVIREQGYIRPVEAGVIVHRERNDSCSRKANQPSATGDRYRGGGVSCCAFASTDGSSALKRLAKRGLVKRLQGGRAVPVDPSEPTNER
jgi:hypothetical protein